MYLFGEGRKALSDFIRNLPSQSIIFSLVIILAYGINKNPEAHDVGFRIFSLCVTGFVCVAVIWANFTLFIDEYLKSIEPIRIESDRLKSDNVKGFSYYGKVIKFSWGFKKVVFFEVFIMPLVLQYILAIILYIGIVNATAYLKVFE